MELTDFPMDIQQLGVTVATKYSKRKVKLIPDPERLSKLKTEALKTFRDQQKWKVKINQKY
jgi:hypothetical protein